MARRQPLRIPKRVHDHLGLAPGTLLIVEERGSSVTLTPLTGEELLTEEDGILVFRGRAEGDLTASATEAREARLDELIMPTLR